MTPAALWVCFLAGFLLPFHRLFRPFKDPVTATVANHRVIQLFVGSLGFAHYDTRLHIKDFSRIDTAPDPHQTVDHAIPVRHVFTIQSGLHGRLRSVIEAPDKRRRFRMFEAGFKQGFAEVSL